MECWVFHLLPLLHLLASLLESTCSEKSQWLTLIRLLQLDFLITKHITKIQLVYHFSAEIIGALLGSLFVKYAVGSNANLGANAPNYSFPIPVIFGIEVLASAFLMVVIFLVVHTKGLKGFSGIAIGGIVGLDIFFFALISGASMNPARSLVPALLSGAVINLWLCWSATFIGTSTIAFVLRKKFNISKLSVIRTPIKGS